MTALRLDEIDILLLDLLQADASQTLHALGEQAGLSASAVQRRIARYRSTGLITKHVAVLNPQLVGPVALALVLVTLAKESAEHHREFADRMRTTREVQQCYAVAGPWDYAVVLAAPSLPRCHELGNELFKADDNIQRYETLLVFNSPKVGLTIPLPSPPQ